MLSPSSATLVPSMAELVDSHRPASLSSFPSGYQGTEAKGSSGSDGLPGGSQEGLENTSQRPSWSILRTIVDNIDRAMGFFRGHSGREVVAECVYLRGQRYPD